MGPIQIWEEADGTFTAARRCTRIQDALQAFTRGATASGVTFPGKLIRTATESDMRDALAKEVVWA
jgi:hypothetical protein